MKLVTQEMRDTIPGQYEQDGLGDKAIVYAKFFCPWNNWTWYVTEMWEEGGTMMFFGLVDGLEVELGPFSLAEFLSVSGPGGLTIERDLHWAPLQLGVVRELIKAQRGE